MPLLRPEPSGGLVRVPGDGHGCFRVQDAGGGGAGRGSCQRTFPGRENLPQVELKVHSHRDLLPRSEFRFKKLEVDQAS